jgi:RNA polymerase sigma factor (sigma-70 family)
MEASALKYHGTVGLQGRAPLLRLQSDERLITLVRRGNSTAFEVLVARYQARLLAFCRHLLGSREDAEDVLQEVMTAAFNAMVADERPINVRPWLYRIARNRCLNHLRRAHAVGVDSMDIHLSDGGETTADKVHKAEEFRLLVDDIQSLPETQRTALVLREMDALSYEQISEAMETTVPSVKSLLVRARMSLAEAAQARQLSCEQVRIELAEVAEGLLAKATPPVRRHLRTCHRCESFQSELKRTSRVLAALLPLGPLALLKQLAFTHIGHSAGAGSGASAGTAAGTGAAVGSGAAAGGALVGAGGMMPIGLGALGVKAAAGLAAAALVTAGAVDLSHTAPAARPHHHGHSVVTQAAAPAGTQAAPAAAVHTVIIHHLAASAPHRAHHAHAAPAHHAAGQSTAKATPVKLTLSQTKHAATAGVKTKPTDSKPPGETQSESIATVMSSGSNPSTAGSSTGSSGTPASDGTPTTTSSPPPSPGSGTPTSGSPGIPLGDPTPTGSGTTTGDATPTGDPTPTGTDSGAPTPPAPTGDPTTGSSTPGSSGGSDTAGGSLVVGAPPA